MGRRTSSMYLTAVKLPDITISCDYIKKKKNASPDLNRTAPKSVHLNDASVVEVYPMMLVNVLSAI